MFVTIEVNAKSNSSLLRELSNILGEIKQELVSPVCIGCLTCKNHRKACSVSGGSYLPVEQVKSDWALSRTHTEHKTICKSKNRKWSICVRTLPIVDTCVSDRRMVKKGYP